MTTHARATSTVVWGLARCFQYLIGMARAFDDRCQMPASTPTQGQPPTAAGKCRGHRELVEPKVSEMRNTLSQLST